MRQTDFQREQILSAAALIGKFTLQWIVGKMLGISRPKERGYLNRKALEAYLGLPTSTVGRMISEDGFPKAKRAGESKRPVWRIDEIDSYLNKE